MARSKLEECALDIAVDINQQCHWNPSLANDTYLLSSIILPHLKRYADGQRDRPQDVGLNANDIRVLSALSASPVRSEQSAP